MFDGIAAAIALAGAAVLVVLWWLSWRWSLRALQWKLKRIPWKDG